MRNKGLIILQCLVASALGFGQPITLGNSNMPGSGDTLRYTNAQVNSVGNYTQTGQNFNWDFSTLVSTTEGLRNYKSALQTPYALFFLSLNEYGEKLPDIGSGTMAITDYYNFYKKQSSPAAFIADGVGMTLSGIPLPSYYTDKDELYKFPMTYPKYDSTTFRFSATTTSLIPIGYSKTGYRVTVVDGWGTVTTPWSTAACLRLITTQYSNDTIKALGIPIGVPNNIRSYQWFSLTSKIPFLEITGNLVGSNFTITQVRYRGFDKSTPVHITETEDVSAIRMYPNPVKDKMWLGNSGADQTFEITDINGRLIITAVPAILGSQTYIDVSTLETGFYLLKVSSGQKTAVCKFIKTQAD